MLFHIAPKPCLDPFIAEWAVCKVNGSRTFSNPSFSNSFSCNSFADFLAESGSISLTAPKPKLVKLKYLDESVASLIMYLYIIDINKLVPIFYK